MLVERQRRYYLSLDIEQLLADCGVNLADPALHEGCWLPLDMFDDDTFDIYTPQKWMASG